MFDGSAARGMSVTNFNRQAYLIGGPSATTLYGSDAAGDLYTLAINSGGVSVASEVGSLIGAEGDPVFAGGLIYDGWGSVVDPAIPAVIATYDNQGLILPFPDLGKVAILGGVPPPGDAIESAPPTLTLNDIAGGTRLWTLSIPAQTTLNHGPMIRWEQNGSRCGNRGLTRQTRRWA